MIRQQTPTDGAQRPIIPTQRLTIRTEDSTGAVVVYVAGEIDLATAPTLQTCLTAQLECSTQHPVLVVDLAAVDFISCAGLRVLLEAQQHAAVHGTAFRLAGCSRVVLRLLNLADLHGEFDSYPTVRDALGWSARRQA